MTLPTVANIPSLAGTRVLVRASLNVPVREGVVAGRFRLTKTAETISFLKKAGARVIVIGHIGRKPEETLAPVSTALMELVPHQFVGDLWSEEATAAIATMHEGEVLLAENIRRYPGETDNDPVLAEKLAALAEVYVNDAFSDSHRTHASIVGVPKLLPTYAGFQFAREVEALSRALAPESPSLGIIGGAKFETKEAMLRAVLPKYDRIFVGGAIAHDFFRAQGFSVGRSLVSEHPEAVAAFADSPKIVTPIDLTVAGDDVGFRTPEEVGEDDIIMDCGPQTIAVLKELINESQFVLWNGPLGNYEKGYSARTEELARLLAESSATAIVGGGDTVASIEALGIEERFAFVSTGGGAMLDFVADGSLPGVDAIIHSPRVA